MNLYFSNSLLSLSERIFLDLLVLLLDSMYNSSGQEFSGQE